MLAILGDLTVLESQLEEEIQSERVKRDTLISEIKCNTEYLLPSTVHEESKKGNHAETIYQRTGIRIER